MKHKKEILEKINIFVRKVLKSYEGDKLNLTGLLIVGGSGLIIMDELNSIPTNDIDAIRITKQNKLDWFIPMMREIGLNYDINDQVVFSPKLNHLRKLLNLDSHVFIFETNGINIFIPSVETLILSKINAIIDRSDSKDIDDLNLLMSHDYDKSKLEKLKNKWVEAINKIDAYDAKLFKQKFEEYII